MRAKKRHGPAANLRQQEIVRLRKQAILFKRYMDKELKKALKATPRMVTLTFMTARREPNGAIAQIIHNWPPGPASIPPAGGVR